MSRICASRARVRAIIEGADILVRSCSVVGVDGVKGVSLCVSIGDSGASSDMRRRSEGTEILFAAELEVICSETMGAVEGLPPCILRGTFELTDDSVGFDNR